MPVKVGVDLGNSGALLAWGSRDRRILSIPSYIGSGSGQALARMHVGARAGAAARQGLILSHSGVDMFVGELAIRQSPDVTSARGDVGRYWSGHTKKLLLTLCGLAWPGRGQELYLVTGLPVEVWSEANAQRVADNLLGMHEYSLNGQAQRTNVLGVLVVMEGAGASAQLGGDDPEAQEATLDIGGRTTLAYWTRAQEPVLARCGQLDAGVEKVGDALSVWFEQTYDRPLELWEREQLIRHAIGLAPHPTLHSAGKPVVIDGQLQAELAHVEEEITGFVKRIWRSSEKGSVAAGAARVHLVGGGAYYFGDAIRAIIPHVRIPNHPERQNALGYLAIAQSITDSEWVELAAGG